MQNYLVECAYNSKDDLGESPIWIEEQNSIFWVDIKKCIIHRLNSESNIHSSWTFNEQIGCIAHINQNKFVEGISLSYLGTQGKRIADINTYIYGKDKYFFKKKYKNKIKFQIFKNILEAIKKVIIDSKKINKNYQTNIIFSPSAASFDQFENFEKRGDYFNKLIFNKIKK